VQKEQFCALSMQKNREKIDEFPVKSYCEKLVAMRY